MKKIVSKIYANQKILVFGEVIEFKGEKSEISNELFTKLQKSSFPNIYEEGKETVKKSSEKEDADKTIEVMKKEYLSEINRLNNIIKSKDQEINQLKEDLQSWKEEVEKMKQVKKEISEKEIETRKTLESLDMEGLKKLASEEGMDEKEITKIEKKSELIDYMVSFYMKN